jgi:hypothetical protein
MVLSSAGCDSFTGHPEPREANADVPCGVSGKTIDARRLVRLSEREAIEVGRRHGCVVRVEVRNDQVVANGDLKRHRTVVGVIVDDAHIEGLCYRTPEGACRSLLD